MSKQVGKIWVVRCKGGPLKIVRASGEVAAPLVKSEYMRSFAHRRATAVEDNDEDAWEECRIVEESEIQEKYSNFLIPNSATGKPLALLEIEAPKERRSKRVLPDVPGDRGADLSAGD